MMSEVRSKPIAVVVVVAATVMFLSGCVKMDLDATVNRDDTMSGVFIYGVSAPLAAMAGSDGDLAEQMKEGADGVFPGGYARSEPYRTDDWTGVKLTFEGVPIERLGDGEDPDSTLKDLRVEHVGGEYRLKGSLDLGSEDDTAGTEVTDDYTEAFLAGAELEMSFTFPGAVTSAASGAEIDGRTVTFHPELGKVNDLTAVASDGGVLAGVRSAVETPLRLVGASVIGVVPAASVLGATIVGALVLVLAALALALLIIRSRRRGLRNHYYSASLAHHPVDEEVTYLTSPPGSTYAPEPTMTMSAAREATATVSPVGVAPEPGWMLDPEDGTMLRWWDGDGWSPHRRPR